MDFNENWCKRLFSFGRCYGMHKLIIPGYNALDVWTGENENAILTQFSLKALRVKTKCGGLPITLNKLCCNRVRLSSEVPQVALCRSSWVGVDVPLQAAGLFLCQSVLGKVCFDHSLIFNMV